MSLPTLASVTTDHGRLSVHVSEVNTNRAYIGVTSDASVTVLGPLRIAELREIITAIEVVIHAIEAAEPSTNNA